MRQKQKNTAIWLCGIIFAAGVYLLPSVSNAQTFGGSSGCGQDCNNATCKMATGTNGMLLEKCPSGRRYDVDPNCIMNQNARSGACLDTMPVSSINRVAETNCYRANGAGGNPKPRNHEGTDYAATEGTVVTAAADGRVVWAKWFGGGGRTLMIEHEKKCQCTAGSGTGTGCDNKYITVYMHLKAYLVTGGNVTKGQPIGLVGGSNYVSAKEGRPAQSCDYPTPNGACKPYGPHLHFEIHSGSASKGYTNLKPSIINPLCDDIQTFCGGCPYDVKKCQDKTGSKEWEDLGEEAKADKSAATGNGQMPVQPDPSVGGSTSDSPGLSYAAVSGCELEQFLPKDDECWFCPLFTAIFNTASKIALKAYIALASGIANLVLICFALWTAVFVLKHVTAVEVKSPSKMLQEYLLQTFKVVLVVLILKGSYFQVMNYSLEPVFNTGMLFSQTMTGGGGGCSAEISGNISGFDKKVNSDATGGLPVSMGKNIVCSIKSMQDSVSKLMAFGRQAMCVAWKPKAIIRNIIPSFPYLFTGIVLYIGGLVLLIAFPWCLVDAVLQMAIAAALAPAAIGAWAFKLTAKYLGKIWNFFMNAMFNFVFLSIILYIIMTVVGQFMQRLDAYANESTGWDFLIDPIEGLAYWGITTLQLVVVCLLGWVLLDQAKLFADKFAKGADTGDVGSSVGALAAQAGNKTLGTAAQIGKAGLTAGAQVADHFVGSRIRQARNNYRLNKVKSGSDRVTTDANGNTVYERTRRNLLGQNVTRRVTIGANGKEVWSKEKPLLTKELGNNIRDAANQYRLEKMMKEGTAITDDDGNIIGYQMEHHNAFGQKVTLTAMKGDDGEFHINKEKRSLRMQILSKVAKDGSALQAFADRNAVFKQKELGVHNESRQQITSDSLMSVRKITDNNGNVISEDIQFKPSVIKHIVNKDGTLNTSMLAQIRAGSGFDDKTLNTALALEIMKHRGINISSAFAARDASLDNRGVLHLKQTNADGTTIELNSAFGNGKQMLSEFKQTARDGSYTAILDNGIMKATTTYVAGKENATVSYAFADEYYRRHRYMKPLDGNGNFAAGMDVAAATFGFSEADVMMHAEQVRTGSAHTVNAAYVSAFSQNNEQPNTNERTTNSGENTQNQGQPNTQGSPNTQNQGEPDTRNQNPQPENSQPNADSGPQSEGNSHRYEEPRTPDNMSGDDRFDYGKDWRLDPGTHSESKTDAFGNTTVTTYDRYGNKREETVTANNNPTDIRRAQEYAADGTLQSEYLKDEKGNITKADYYKNGQMYQLKSENTDGSKTELSYYENGTRSRMFIHKTDGSEEETHSYSDGSLEMQRIRMADGSERAESRHENGKLAVVYSTNADGSGERKHFDDEGHLEHSWKNHQDGSSEEIAYSKDGKTQFRLNKNADGSEQQLDYDEKGLMNHQRIRNTDGSEEHTFYDEYGNITSRQTVPPNA